MADLIVDSFTRLDWVPTIANLSAPTTTELTAGTHLTDQIPPDGFDPGVDTAAIDTSALSGKTHTEQGGRDTHKIVLTIKRVSGTDTVASTLIKGATGFLVVRRGTATATAYAADDTVEIYPGECSAQKNMATAENAVDKYQVQIFVTGEPKTSSAPATVAAGA
ncbi:MAG TPA: hypothetical protein VIS06_06995 [Mycobacteriales bacterium]|jgi:hypothetical protein